MPEYTSEGFDEYITQISNGTSLEERYDTALDEIAKCHKLIIRALEQNSETRNYNCSYSIIPETDTDESVIAAMANQWAKDSIDASTFRSLMGVINSDEELLAAWDQLCVLAKLKEE